MRENREDYDSAGVVMRIWLRNIGTWTPEAKAALLRNDEGLCAAPGCAGVVAHRTQAATEWVYLCDKHAKVVEERSLRNVYAL